MLNTNQKKRKKERVNAKRESECGESGCRVGLPEGTQKERANTGQTQVSSCNL